MEVANEAILHGQILCAPVHFRNKRIAHCVAGSLFSNHPVMNRPVGKLFELSGLHEF
jgi:hypothetical protein